MTETEKDSPRQRMIQSAALLMREHGVEAMSFSQVVQHSGAPRGSIYHYFPGGKSQLVEEATRWAGEFIAKRTSRAIASQGPLAFLDDSERFWGDVLGGTDFASGCPVVAATLDGERSPAARAAAAEAFRRWESVFAGSLREHGISDERAAALGTMVFASIEGAVIMSRAARSLDPLTRVLGELRIIVSAALELGAHQPRTASS